MDSSVCFLRVSQRKNPKRGTEVQEYQVHCVKSTRETLMTLVLEKIMQELDPALRCEARICLHLESKQDFCYLSVTLDEWKTQPKEIHQTLLEQFRQDLNKQDTFYLRLQICY